MITPAQQRALELSASGLLVKEIALELGISVRTVEAHLSDTRERLEAKTTTQAVVLAIKKGLINFMIVICTVNALSTNYSMDMRRPARTTVRVVRTVRNGSKEA